MADLTSVSGKWIRGLGLGAHPDEPLSLRAAHRRVTVATVGALVIAMLLGAFLLIGHRSPAVPVPHFVYVLALPTLVGALFAAVCLIAEMSWPKPRTAQRGARVVARSVGDIVPRPLAIANYAASGLLAVVVLAGTMLSRDGVNFAWGWNERSGTFLGVVTNTTFPGARVTAPIIAVVLVLLGLTWWTVFVTLSRPAVIRATHEQDLRLRRTAAGRVLRVATATILVTDGALISLAGAAVATAFRGTWLGDSGTIVAYLGLAVAACALALAIPQRRTADRVAHPGSPGGEPS